MIDTIQGTVSSRTTRSVVIHLPVGVSLGVQVPDEGVFGPGKEVRLYTHLVLSGAASGDGEFKLYGFATKSDRLMFLLLKSVSGVGGKAALAVMSKGLANVVDAITNNEPNALKVKGVGPKTTKRIVDDLQKKVAASFDNLVRA
jgi:Holliday junction DNA helicase RuvA